MDFFIQKMTFNHENNTRNELPSQNHMKFVYQARKDYKNISLKIYLSGGRRPSSLPYYCKCDFLRRYPSYKTCTMTVKWKQFITSEAVHEPATIVDIIWEITKVHNTPKL